MRPSLFAHVALSNELFDSALDEALRQAESIEDEVLLEIALVASTMDLPAMGSFEMAFRLGFQAEATRRKFGMDKAAEVLSSSFKDMPLGDPFGQWVQRHADEVTQPE